MTAETKKILIVDDEPHIRLLLEQALEELEEVEGVGILMAPDGETGLALAERERPGLVFLDVMMPGMSGFDVIREIRSRPEMASVSVILLTAKGQVTDREEGMSCGAADYLTKPFDPDQVFELACRFLGV